MKIVVAGIGAFFIFIWNKLTLNYLETEIQKERIFPFNKHKEISFNDNFIIVAKNNSITVFSSHCTHLGCKIDKLEDDRFVCPCHGSEYNLNGKVIKGPAFKNLEIVPSRISEDGNDIIIGG